MTIERIEIYQAPIKLKEPFVIALGPMEYANNVLVVISTGNGMKGYGECSPFMTINGESMETAFYVGQYLARVLLAMDPLDIASCSVAMDKVIYGNSSIKSAFDMALYDIASQEAGLPLYAYLGGNNGKTLYTDYTVSLGKPEKMAKDALKIREAGFQSIKVKLGESKDADIERIKRIREAVGFGIPLRVDANQGWNTDEAIATLKALGPYNIQYCEEPIPRWNYTELGRVSKESPVPVMADESCADHHDAKRLIAMHACPLFNLKLGKSSGIFKALKIIRLAEQAGIKMQVGGFLESRLAFTASAHLALASENIEFCDFDSPLMLNEDPVIGGLTYHEEGRVTLPEIPGLGARPDSQYLKGLTMFSATR